MESKIGEANTQIVISGWRLHSFMGISFLSLLSSKNTLFATRKNNFVTFMVSRELLISRGRRSF